MDTQLLPYRLKSPRRKRRLLIEDRDKQILELDREWYRIRRDPDYKKTVPLDEPYQKGWKRLFVLKPEVAKSDKAEFYQQILDVINTVQYHYDESFKNSKRVSKWHRYYHDELPTLKPYYEYPFYHKKLTLTDEQRSYFMKVEYWNESRHEWAHKYEFTEPWRFKIVVMPHMIYEVEQVDTVMQQQLAWIDNQFYKNNKIHRLINLQRSYNGWKDRSEKLKHRNPLKNKPIWKIAEKYDQEVP